LFEAGRVAFEANRYADALQHFQRAFDLSRRFQLQYNLGLAYDRLRRDEEALQAFEAYLSGDSTGDRADEVRARVQALKASVASRAVPVVAPAPTIVTQPAPPAAVDSDRSAIRKRRIWIAVGSVLAVAARVTVGLVVAAGDDPAPKRPEPNTGIHVEALSW
jgi:tetratricopeptide (TPR) repeat protein